MATTITDDCISCGACEPECPNNAIRQADPIYVIDPQLCTECVGFHDQEACAAVCPVDCCVPDPNIVETEDVLIARARALHQDTQFGENFPSRFRKGDAQPEAAKAATASDAPVAAAADGGVTAGSKPLAGAGGSDTAAGPNGEARAVPTGSAIAAPGPTANPAPAEMKSPGSGKSPDGPAPRPNGEAKPAQAAPASPPREAPVQSDATTTAAAPAVTAAKAVPKAAAPKPAPAKVEPPPKKTFPKELPDNFKDLSNRYVVKRSGSLSKGLPRLAVLLSQPILGALPHDAKKRLEQEVQSPFFTAAGSTGLNILHNALLYPLVFVIIAAVAHGPAVIFSQQINMYLLIGIILALAEGVYRLKDGIVHLKPADEIVFRAALYGVPLGLVLQPLLKRTSGLIRDVPIPVDGFYSPGFVEKLERERRYGNVYTVEDRGEAFLLRMEFPRRIPEIGLSLRSDLPDEMPDYDYDLALKDGHFVVKGWCADPRVRNLSSSVGAFPPEFTTVVPLQEKVVGFGHQFENKCLQVLLVKDTSHRRERSHR